LKAALFWAPFCGKAANGRMVSRKALRGLLEPRHGFYWAWGGGGEGGLGNQAIDTAVGNVCLGLCIFYLSTDMQIFYYVHCTV
jgi:hypothetical protein